MYLVGVICALVALFGWGIGDFYIQKSTRKIGDIESLFFICAAATIVLLPFVLRDFSLLNRFSLAPLLVLTIATFLAAGLNMEALRIGKISVVETIMGVELPLTLLFSYAFKSERLTGFVIFLIFVVFAGVILAGQKKLSSVIHLDERGVILGTFGAVCLAMMNVFMGISSNLTSPLFANWFSSAIVAVVLLLYMLRMQGGKALLSHLKQYPEIIWTQSISDNIAWIAFAYATVFIPVAVATTIAEGYVALAVLLGISFNKEKLRPHQMFGIGLVILGITVMAAIY